MSEFYRLHNQNNTLLFSDSHTNMIAYLDLLVYMSGFFNMITLHIHVHIAIDLKHVYTFDYEMQSVTVKQEIH